MEKKWERKKRAETLDCLNSWLFVLIGGSYTVGWYFQCTFPQLTRYEYFLVILEGAQGIPLDSQWWKARVDFAGSTHSDVSVNTILEWPQPFNVEFEARKQWKNQRIRNLFFFSVSFLLFSKPSCCRRCCMVRSLLPVYTNRIQNGLIPKSASKA